ncbi:Anaphase-promoting complex subunit 10 [Spraguea lophii 42_110]|uniref:Anaphase-promoting complex subunit 10 n=1 Tax=Spraguea lophii (strain 42_110) TaxID=1358809 RepID=S7XK12_SPRLO|nr:Anaphase-promoting complex subunit 10 [Spraguea lophii 42_110]
MEIRLSSFKKNYGLEQLLSKDESTYWYTDGSLPHYIEISFRKRTYVEYVQILFSFSKDDSYTPDYFEVLVGDTKDTLQKYKSITMVEPEGYTLVNINLHCVYIYINILRNCQEGRDSHVRHLIVNTQQPRDMQCK